MCVVMMCLQKCIKAISNRKPTCRHSFFHLFSPMNIWTKLNLNIKISHPTVVMYFVSSHYTPPFTYTLTGHLSSWNGYDKFHKQHISIAKKLLMLHKSCFYRCYNMVLSVTSGLERLYQQRYLTSNLGNIFALTWQIVCSYHLIYLYQPIVDAQ